VSAEGGNAVGPSPYERAALVQIAAWKNRRQTGLARVAHTVTWPVEKAAGLVMSVPYSGEAIEKSLVGVLGLLNDLSQWSVRPDAIYARYRRAGHKVEEGKDIYALDLQNVDSVIGYLRTKYGAICALEGAATGSVGAVGIAADVVAVVSANLRAVGQYATYCGFNASLEHERDYALRVLGLASSPANAAKALAIAELTRISAELARKKTWSELERHALVAGMKKIAESLGVRLTKAKLANFLPGAGAAIGGGYNVYFASNVCRTANYVYRERFLAEKYGPEIIGVGFGE